MKFILLAAAALAQDFSDVKVEKIAAGYTAAEGPVWSRDGYWLWSDVPANRIIKLVPGEKTALYRENSNGAQGNAFDAKGNLYTCESRARRVTRTGKKGVIEVLADNWEGKRLNAPNDIVVRRDGHVYFSDPAFGSQDGARELDFYGVYHIPPKGPMELAARMKGRPNGVALSPDGKALYVTNSDERSVYVYDLDNKGAAANERILIKEVDGAPNGVRVDQKGNLYVAAKGLAIYTPQGKLLHTIEMSETPRNAAFGDVDFQSLYITAMTSVYRIRLAVKGSVQY